MDTVRWREVRELFERVCDLGAAERDVVLSEACADDSELRAEVESILSFSERTPTYFDAPAMDAFPELMASERAASLIGQRIGPYELDELIASGGMGTVYLGRRVDRSQQQKLAIKMIRQRIVGKETLRRFRIEREALGRLSHANIARLLDGSVTPDGIPCLVMEFVDGRPIDDYCREERLTVAGRLELFIQVCAACHFAHQNLVVHRDLKPKNILVTSSGVAKLVDFGIAKILDDGGTAESGGATVSGQRMMTPEYASPEQIQGKAITTASDVFSLGVILYELLARRRPYSSKDVTPHELERMICEDDPVKPSVAVCIGERPPDDGRKLSRRLAGDLDAIVLKAMRKEPEQRYRSVEQFSEDIQRHLHGLPVRARRDTFRYRSGKFVRRNRMALIGAGVLLITFLAGVGGILWQGQVAAQERDRADAARRMARSEALKAERVSTFLQTMLSSVQPGNKGRDVSVRDVLDAAADKIGTTLRDEPEVEATIRATIGVSYGELGLLDKAEPHLTKALTIRNRVLGPRHSDVAESLSQLGVLARAKGNFADAEKFYRKALQIFRELPAHDDMGMAGVLNNLGVVLKSKGEYEEAEAAYRESLGIRQARLGSKHREVATTLNNLASVQKNQGRLSDAASTYREALSIFQSVLGEEHIHVAVCMNNLALLLRETGDWGEATRLLREALGIRRKAYREGHPGVATGLHNLGLLLAIQGETAEAEALYQEALTIRLQALGERHPHVAYTATNLAELLARRGDFESAEPLCRDALAIRREKLPSGHASIASSLQVLGRIWNGMNQAERAENSLREAVAILEKLTPSGSRKLGLVKSELGYSLLIQERFPEAEGMLLAGYELLGSAPGASELSQRELLERIIRLYDARNKPELAARYRAELGQIATTP